MKNKKHYVNSIRDPSHGDSFGNGSGMGNFTSYVRGSKSGYQCGAGVYTGSGTDQGYGEGRGSGFGTGNALGLGKG